MQEDGDSDAVQLHMLNCTKMSQIRCTLFTFCTRTAVFHYNIDTFEYISCLGILNINNSHLLFTSLPPDLPTVSLISSAVLSNESSYFKHCVTWSEFCFIMTHNFDSDIYTLFIYSVKKHKSCYSLLLADCLVLGQATCCRYCCMIRVVLIHSFFTSHYTHITL